MLFKLTLVYTLTGEFKSQIKPVVLLRLVLTTLEIQSSRESTIWICSASHSGNEQYTHSPIPLDPNINQSHHGVSDLGGPKTLLFYRLDTARVLSIG